MIGEHHTTVDLIRHGEPVGGKRFRGQSDDPLSETGWAQMRAAVAGATPWTAVVTSPLTRCRAFAEALAGERDLPLRVEPDFREIGFGEWEGRTHAEVEGAEPHALRAFRADPAGHRPPGAEPVGAFRARLATAWERLLASEGDGHVLLVAHAGVIRGLVAGLLEAPDHALFRMSVGYASLTRLAVHELDGDIWPQIVTHAAPLPEAQA